MKNGIFEPISVAPVPRITLSVLEAAEALGLSERTVRELIKTGELPVVSVGARQLLPTKGLEAWAEEQTSRAPRKPK